MYLSSLRFASIGLKYSLLSFVAFTNLLYVLALIAIASVSGGIHRSNYSFILVVVILYVGPNIVGLSSDENERNFELWIMKSLTAFCSVYALSCFINDQLFWKISPPAGLVTPHFAAAMFLSVRNKNIPLFILVILNFIGIAGIHYQSSYMLVPICVFIVLLGNKVRFLRLLTYIFLASYSVLVVFTDLLTWMLSLSGSEGYDNVIIRVAFVEYGIKFVQENLVFGGALVYPITILIKNAGYFTTLPLHSDALTWLIGTGSIGWFLYSFTTFLFIKKCWKQSTNSLQNSVAVVLLCNYLTGFFNSQYSTFAFLFSCFYTVALSVSPIMARRFLSA